MIDTEPPHCPFDRCQPARTAEQIASGWDFEYGTTRDEFPIGRCRECGVVCLLRVPTAAMMGVIYPGNYYAFSESSSENSLVKPVRDRLEIAKVRAYRGLVGDGKAEVLDVGCGDGRLLDILRRHGPADWRYSGIELGEAAAARAGAKGYDVLTGDFDGLDLDAWAGRFDLVLMHQVLEHTRQPRATMQRVRRLLKPGGIFSIETPDTRAWDMSLFRRRHWGGYHIPRHFYLFDQPSLRRLAGECGFEVLSCRSILSPVFWIHSLHNWCADRPGWSRIAPFIHTQNVAWLAMATTIELVQVHLFGRSSNMQLLARRTGA